jgi:hypothetical protein
MLCKARREIASQSLTSLTESPCESIKQKLMNLCRIYFFLRLLAKKLKNLLWKTLSKNKRFFFVLFCLRKIKTKSEDKRWIVKVRLG